MSRVNDLNHFYNALERLSVKTGGALELSQCNGRMIWPTRGVYFFYEPGEKRSSGFERVVRIGTHALTANSQTKLWDRLAQHRGTVAPKGGNHRGSVFRKLIGEALFVRYGAQGCASWGSGASASSTIRESERAHEVCVSDYIGGMRFLCLAVDDQAGPESIRGYIERNSIAMLSNFKKASIDPPSADWLGRDCPRDLVQASGLWNQNHVDESYDPDFLNIFERFV